MVKNFYKKLSPKVKLTLMTDEKVFGSGVSELLHLIEKYESMQKACKIMDMSYSKAWKIVSRLEKELGIKVVEGKAGGEKGGLSTLTDEGKLLIKKYDAMAKDIDKYSKDVFKKYFK